VICDTTGGMPGRALSAVVLPQRAILRAG
jgi:hypothetical protein